MSKLSRLSKKDTNTRNINSDLQRLTNKSFSGLIEEFLATKKSSQTKRAYKKDIETFFQAINISSVGELATLPVYELSKVIITYIESFKKTEKHRSDRVQNPRTLNRKAYALSSFFEYLVANYGYPRNPVKVYAPYSTPDKTSTDDLEKQEVEAIRTYVRKQIENAKTPFQILTKTQQMLIFAFLILSLRRNEVAKLRWDDRNRQKGYITVFGKGQKYKYLPLNEKITGYLADFEGLKRANGYSSEYIFSPLRSGVGKDLSKPVSGTYIFTLVQTIAKELQTLGQIDMEKKVTPHSFRTTFVKMALDKGKTDIEIMNTTGHSTSQMVKYYDSRSPLEVNAAEVLDEVF